MKQFEELRQAYDQVGAVDKKLLIVGDGSFCNRTVFGAQLERTEVIARVRKDAKLCFVAQPGSRRYYSEEKFTPEKVRKDETIAWKEKKFYTGGKWRKVRYKEVEEVLWQRGAKRKTLRLIVLAATPYRKRKSSKLYYRQPGYLLTTDLKIKVDQLIQSYIDRWQIEINHRELKTTLGVGEAQVWSKQSVSRQPAFTVAAYSMLLLTATKCFGNLRSDIYYKLPKWRSDAKRPSIQDIINLLRKEVVENPQIMEKYGAVVDSKSTIMKAVA